MYEIRKAGKIYRIYDKKNEKYIGYTRDENKANMYVSNLYIRGWEGNIPNFMLAGLKYGIDMDMS